MDPSDISVVIGPMKRDSGAMLQHAKRVGYIDLKSQTATSL